MTMDLDSYYLKCILDRLENHEEKEGLEELCAFSVGIAPETKIETQKQGV